jgi:mersacidin/lichenicidin family type 2 lantibiotic
MSPQEIIRAWKDAEYRASLGDAAQQLPENPAGFVEMDDADLNVVSGGAAPNPPIRPKPRTPRALCPIRTVVCTAATCPTGISRPTCLLC